MTGRLREILEEHIIKNKERIRLKCEMITAKEQYESAIKKLKEKRK